MKLRNKGFTLIELMIVVVILGVLMSTVLPKLTGAQARARDTGRIADLGNIAAALTTYYDDNGQFPGTTDTAECLDNAAGAGQAISIYLEGNKVPKDPQKNANVWVCNTTEKGKYWYAPLTKVGIGMNAYVLCADMETYQKANTDLGGIVTTQATPGPSALDSFVYSTNSPLVGSTNYSAEDTGNAGQSAYCVIRP